MAATLEEILAKLLVPDTSVLKQATHELKAIFKDPAIVEALCTVLGSSANAQVRQYSAVLLRRKVTKKRKWFLLSLENRNGVKFTVLKSLQDDPEKSVKNAVAQLAGTIAKHEFPRDTWPELLRYLQLAVTSSKLADREVGIFALSIVASTAGEQLQPHLKGLLSLLCKTLYEADVKVIPFYTIKALTALVFMIGTEEMHVFQNMVPRVLQVTCQLVNEDEEKACEALQIFDELVECEVGIIAPHVKPVIDFCLEMAGNSSLGDDIRVKALTFISWFARLKKKAILKHKLVLPILKVVFPIMCKTSCDVEDDGEGGTEDDIPIDGAEANTPTSVAAQVIDVLALHLPPEKLLPPLMNFIEPALSNGNIYHRKAAYIALAVTAEGCADHIRNRYMQSYLQCTCKGITDPHPIVRNAALFALGQFSEHLQPEIARFASDLLPLLFGSLSEICRQLHDGGKDPPSLTKIFYALENFCESLGDGIVVYLPSIMEQLFAALSCSSSVNMQELAISAIGATANAATVAMLPYFNDIMSRLKVYLASPHSNENMPVQIQALDTLAVLARTIGTDTFSPLVPECIQLGLSLIDVVDDPDLRRCTYGLFASISSILKEEMALYLPIILTHMINSLKSMDGVVLHSEENKASSVAIFEELSDEDDAPEEDLLDDDCDDDDDDDDVVGTNVANAYLDEKEDTCCALREIATNSGTSFLPFLTNVSEEVYRLMDHPVAAVRKAAIEALGAFCCVLHKGTVSLHASEPAALENKKAVSKMISILLPKLTVIVREDKERTVAMGALDAINDMVKSLQRNLLEGRGNLHTIVAVIKDVMQSKVSCQDQSDVDGVEDLADDQQQAEQDAMLIEYAGDILPSLAKAVSGQEFAPYFAGVVSLLVNKTKPSLTVAERSFAIGTLAECVAAMKESIVPFVSHLVPVFMTSAQDSDEEVRSNAIFGLGVLAEHGGVSIYPHYASLLQLLSNALSKEEDPRAMDNICGAVARIILANVEAVPLDQVFPVLIQYLPLRQDFDENITIFKCISYLFTLKYAQVLSHMPKILEVVAKVSHTDAANPETQAVLDQLVSDVRCNFAAEFQNVLSSMSPDLANKLR